MRTACSVGARLVASPPSSALADEAWWWGPVGRQAWALGTRILPEQEGPRLCSTGQELPGVCRRKRQGPLLKNCQAFEMATAEPQTQCWALLSTRPGPLRRLHATIRLCWGVRGGFLAVVILDFEGLEFDRNSGE